MAELKTGAYGGQGCGNIRLDPSNNSEIPNLYENKTETDSKE